MLLETWLGLSFSIAVSDLCHYYNYDCWGIFSTDLSHYGELRYVANIMSVGPFSAGSRVLKLYTKLYTVLF